MSFSYSTVLKPPKSRGVMNQRDGGMAAGLVAASCTPHQAEPTLRNNASTHKHPAPWAQTGHARPTECHGRTWGLRTPWPMRLSRAITAADAIPAVAHAPHCTAVQLMPARPTSHLDDQQGGGGIFSKCEAHNREANRR